MSSKEVHGGVSLTNLDQLLFEEAGPPSGTAAQLIAEGDLWGERMPEPQRLGSDLIEEGRAIPVARVQAMHEGKRRACRRGLQGQVIRRCPSSSTVPHQKRAPDLGSFGSGPGNAQMTWRMGLPGNALGAGRPTGATSGQAARQGRTSPAPRAARTYRTPDRDRGASGPTARCDGSGCLPCGRNGPRRLARDATA